MRKKLLSVLLTAGMLAGILSGCSRSTGTAPEETGGGQEAEASSVSREEEKGKSDVTIQVIVPGNFQEFPEGIDENNNFIVDYWREKTGYDFDIVILPTGDEGKEKLNLMFNGGQVEGVVFTQTTYKASQMAAQGLLEPLDSYLADNTLYNQYKDIQALGEYDGSQYGIVVPTDGIFAQGSLTVARKDIMTANGFAQQPKTFEEFNDLLYMFKDQGMTAMAVYDSPTKKPFDMFLSMFGISSTHASNFMLGEDGKLQFKMISDQAKDYLAYMHQLYVDGIIPKDFASLDITAANELYLGGKAGMVANDIAWQMPQLFQSSEELGYDSRYLDYPTDFYGNTAYGDTHTNVANQVIMVAKGCPYTAEIMDFLNFLMEPETLMLNNYGIEGEHYELADGVPKATEKASDIAWGVYYRNIFLPEDWYQAYGVGADWAEYYYPSERHTIGKEIYDLQLPVSGEVINKRDDLTKTIVDPYFTKVITGEESLDSFDDFVQEWLGAGGREITDEYNRLFEESGKEPYVVTSYLPEEHPEYTGKYLFDGPEQE